MGVDALAVLVVPVDGRLVQIGDGVRLVAVDGTVEAHFVAGRLLDELWFGNWVGVVLVIPIKSYTTQLLFWL